MKYIGIFSTFNKWFHHFLIEVNLPLEYMIYSAQNIKNILNRTYDIFWAEYIIYRAHLVGILDLWDLSDGKGEGKVHLLLPRRLVCKSQIEIPNAKNKPYFLKKESTHRGRVAWWPRSPWVYTKEPSRDPGSSARAASRHKITVWIQILHSLQSLVFFLKIGACQSSANMICREQAQTSK